MGTTSDTPNQSAVERSATRARVEQLNSEGKTGKEVATILWEEDTSIEVALEAFLFAGYAAAIEQFDADTQELHISDNPSGAGLAILIMSAEPRTLASVVWKKQNSSE